MRSANVHAAATRLDQSLKTLARAWDDVRSGWSDQVAEQFEKNYLIELDRRVRGAVVALGELSEVLARMYAECE